MNDDRVIVVYHNQGEDRRVLGVFDCTESLVEFCPQEVLRYNEFKTEAFRLNDMGGKRIRYKCEAVIDASSGLGKTLSSKYLLVDASAIQERGVIRDCSIYTAEGPLRRYEAVGISYKSSRHAFKLAEDARRAWLKEQGVANGDLPSDPNNTTPG